MPQTGSVFLADADTSYPRYLAPAVLQSAAWIEAAPTHPEGAALKHNCRALHLHRTGRMHLHAGIDLQQLIEVIGDALIASDPAGAITQWNPAA